MAESTSIDARPHNGQDDYMSPRPRKPTRIDLLKPQLSDESMRRHLEAASSGVSRSASPAIHHAGHDID